VIGQVAEDAEDIPGVCPQDYRRKMGRHEARRPGVIHFPRRMVVAGGVVLTLVLVVAVALAIRNGDSSSGPTPGAGASSTASHRQSTSASPPLASAKGSTASPSMMAMGPTLELRAVGTSWVEVRGPNDNVLVARTFHRGESATFTQRRVHVTLGNAGAMRIKANGMPVEPGRPGQVEIMSVVRGGD
jgi:hypothetical protein